MKTILCQFESEITVSDFIKTLQAQIQALNIKSSATKIIFKNYPNEPTEDEGITEDMINSNLHTIIFDADNLELIVYINANKELEQKIATLETRATQHELSLQTMAKGLTDLQEVLQSLQTTFDVVMEKIEFTVPQMRFRKILAIGEEVDINIPTASILSVESLNDDIITVDGTGDSIKLTGIKEGNGTIRIIFKDNYVFKLYMFVKASIGNTTNNYYNCDISGILNGGYYNVGDSAIVYAITNPIDWEQVSSVEYGAKLFGVGVDGITRKYGCDYYELELIATENFTLEKNNQTLTTKRAKYKITFTHPGKTTLAGVYIGDRATEINPDVQNEVLLSTYITFTIQQK